MKNIYDVDAGDVYWAASDVGWVVGHSYIVYAPLLAGCTTVMYEGKPVGTPDAGAFWRVISQHKVKVLFTAPTAFRAIKRDDPKAAHMANYDLSSLKALYLAGERSDPDTLQWAENSLGVPVIDHWWQTETGWSICANPRGIELLPIKYGSPTVAACGWDVQVLDEAGKPLERGQIGALAAKLPLPPGTLPTLWQNDDRFKSSYLEEFPGFYATGMPALLTKTATSTSCRALMTSSTLPGTACRPGAWKKSFQAIPMLRNVRSLVCMMILRGNCRWALSC